MLLADQVGVKAAADQLGNTEEIAQKHYVKRALHAGRACGTRCAGGVLQSGPGVSTQTTSERRTCSEVSAGNAKDPARKLVPAGSSLASSVVHPLGLEPRTH